MRNLTHALTLERLSQTLKALPEEQLALKVKACQERIEGGSASFEDFDLYVACQQEMQMRLEPKVTRFQKYRASA